MAKILVVDDEETIRDEIREGIETHFPDVQLSIAGDVASGTQMIDNAYLTNSPFDAAILDFMLPPNAEAKEAKFDDTLCQLLRRRMPDTLVIHITYYPKNTDVQIHVDEYHGIGRWNPPMKLLNKNVSRPTYLEQLVPLLKRYIYSSRVEAMLDELFGGRDVPAGVLRSRGGLSTARSRRSYTHRLMTLEGEIVQRWHELDEATQERIRSIFIVNETNEVEIGLL